MTDDDVFDDELIGDENHTDEQFQIQSSENDKKFILVNTRIDYQYRSDILNNVCLYDFVSALYTTEKVDHPMNVILSKINIHKQQHI